MTKKRPKLNRRSVAAVVAATLVVLLALVYLNYRRGLEPVSSDRTAQVFEIKTGDNAPRVATKLKDAGLIRSRNAFITYINLHGLRTKILAGTYSISPSLSAAQIADLLASGKTLSHRVVIPEGYRLRQITNLVASRGVDETQWKQALAAPHNQEFLKDKPADVDLEGYLFPDSYELSSKTTAAQLLDEMLDNFGRKVGPEYVRAFAAQGLNLHQGLTLASIVEREVNKPDDRAKVAQVFLKRFHMGMALGSDVTTHYAADQLGVAFDVNLNSPYNTRRFVGLPPGPICNPGLSSLDAVARPASTDYLFFVSGTDGTTYFAKTYAEHQRNVDRYLK